VKFIHYSDGEFKINEEKKMIKFYIRAKKEEVKTYDNTAGKFWLSYLVILFAANLIWLLS
jgi:hypothetical protein